MAAKRILVVGATGRQGKSLVRELRPKEGEGGFEVLALTRKTTTAKAKELGSLPYVTLVQANLDKPDTVRQVFEDAKAQGGIWGVFVALAFPGLGANADGEERQGKVLADLALEYGVSTFIFSSVERGGEGQDHLLVLDRLAKLNIERHVRSLGDKGLNWTILRPGFFMENFEGTIGNITVGVLKAGLKPTIGLQLVAVNDIGRVAAGVFRNPTEFKSKILVVVGEVLTMPQQEEAYQNASGRSRPSIPAFLARWLISINSHTQGLITETENVWGLIQNNPVTEAQMADARKANPVMTSFHAWVAERHGKPSEREANWNQISIGKLATGQQ